MVIGDRLRELRETKKLSQGDIEKRTGLLRCYISRVENGHTVPAIETLEKLARALEIPLYQLFLRRRRTAQAAESTQEEDVGRHRIWQQRQTADLPSQIAEMPEQSGGAGPETHHGHGAENGCWPRPSLGGGSLRSKRAASENAALEVRS